MIYQNDSLREISFPLGGIGTGCIGLAGNGEFLEWEIFNRPAKGEHNPFTFFAIRAERADGTSIVKVLQGDHTNNLSGQFTGGRGFAPYFGTGAGTGTMSGFPHFRSVVFEGCFPIAKLTFLDDDFPAEVVLEAFNPFIPHDSKNSSLALALFNIKVKSHSDGIKYSIIFSTRNPFPKTVNEKYVLDGIHALKMKYAEVEKNDVQYGDITIATNAKNGFVHKYWFRGKWQDNITTFWRELCSGTFVDRNYDTSATWDIGSVGASSIIDCGQEENFSFTLTWNVPNCYNYWSPYKDENGNDVMWKNFYATVFEDSYETAKYTFKNYNYLTEKTRLFTKTLHCTTLDSAVIDAISSTLSVLKSPTVLRLENGEFYGWEGVTQSSGSCEGTCTHVWSYAYALCFLFPDLERSIRETEFKFDTNEHGKMGFRTQLPLGREQTPYRACLDGQMASVMKAYREWKISGDDEWLKTYYPTVKLLMEYTWSEENPDRWDFDCDGILEGMQHHTLDLEMFGPSSWLESMYLGALSACKKMATYLNDIEFAEKCRKLFDNGYKFIKENLFNGKYFIHKVDIEDSSLTDKFGCREKLWNDECGELKYQIGDGCEIDQMLGAWHSNIIGLDQIFDQDQMKEAMKNAFDILYKPSMRNLANPWRIFAINDEAGVIMCDYPSYVRRPIIPISYESECMTGFEYAFAGLLISEGMINEGLTIVRAIRDRYDGKKRNPYNEIECGNNYARAMASFALLPIFSGFDFDIPHGHIGFSPIVFGDFNCLWSVGNAWGNYEKLENRITVSVYGGNIDLCSLGIGASNAQALRIDGCDVSFSQNGNTLNFDITSVTKCIEVIL